MTRAGRLRSFAHRREIGPKVVALSDWHEVLKDVADNAEWRGREAENVAHAQLRRRFFSS